MRKIEMYVLYDKKAEVFDTPVFFLNDVTAKRWFFTLVQKGEGRFEYFKDDMELYKVCKFDVITGNVEEVNLKKVLDGIQTGKEITNNEKRNEA